MSNPWILYLNFKKNSVSFSAHLEPRSTFAPWNSKIRRKWNTLVLIPSLRVWNILESSGEKTPTGWLSSFHSYPLWKIEFQSFSIRWTGLPFPRLQSSNCSTATARESNGPSVDYWPFLHSRHFSPLMLSYRKGISVDLDEKHLAFKVLAPLYL